MINSLRCRMEQGSLEMSDGRTARLAIEGAEGNRGITRGDGRGQRKKGIWGGGVGGV